MPQIQVFDCPSCGASLSYDGGPETTITCQFCGTTVVIPEELRAKAAPPPPAYPGAVYPGAQGQAAPPPVYPGAAYPGAGGQPVSPDQAALIAMLQQLAQHVASTSPDKAARVAAALRAVEQMANQGTFYPGGAGQATHVNQAAMAAVESLARAGQMMEA